MKALGLFLRAKAGILLANDSRPPDDTHHISAYRPSTSRSQHLAVFRESDLKDARHRAFDGRSRLVRRDATGALKRDFGIASRIRYALFLFTAGLLATLVGGRLAAAEKIYKVVDEEGNITVTDRPPNDADAIVESHSIVGTNTTPAIATAPENIVKTGRSDIEAFYLTRIVYPANESTTTVGPGDFVVEAEISSRLDSEEQRILLIDGAAVGAPESSPRWQLTNVFRRTHRFKSCASVERERRRANPLNTRFMSCDPR